MQAVIYTVQPGDSLSLISKKLYGDFSMVNKLVEMNKIANPNLIHPGQQLLVPDVPGAIQDAVIVDDGQATVTTSTSSSTSIWRTQVAKWFPWIFVAAAAGVLYYSSQKKKKTAKGLKGEIEVDELVLYTINDGDIYRQKAKPIIDNLHKKFKKGTYDKTLAVKAWLSLADLGAKKYAKDYAKPADWNKIFSPADRREAAKEFERRYFEEVENP